METKSVSSSVSYTSFDDLPPEMQPLLSDIDAEPFIQKKKNLRLKTISLKADSVQTILDENQYIRKTLFAVFNPTDKINGQMSVLQEVLQGYNFATPHLFDSATHVFNPDEFDLDRSTPKESIYLLDLNDIQPTEKDCDRYEEREPFRIQFSSILKAALSDRHIVVIDQKQQHWLIEKYSEPSMCSIAECALI